MNIHDRLFVEIHPLEAGQIPHPHPVTEGRFDPALVYKVLGMYNASETSECYFILVNTQRQIWFIPQRHLLAYGLIDSSEFFLTREAADRLRDGTATDGLTAALPIVADTPHLTLAGPVSAAGRTGTPVNGNHATGRNGFATETIPTTDRRRDF